MNTREAVYLALRIIQTGTLIGILYVVWWDANHGIYPLTGGI